MMFVVGGSVPTLEELSSGLFDSVSFNVSHLTVDAATGRLYVGAVNRLYELSPELDRLREVVTGPYPDNPMCPPPPEPCRCTVISCRGGTERLPVDGVTKTLLIDYDARQLIHCTNLFQVSVLRLRCCHSCVWRRSSEIELFCADFLRELFYHLRAVCAEQSRLCRLSVRDKRSGPD